MKTKSLNIFVGVALLAIVGLGMAKNSFWVWFDLIVGGLNLYVANLGCKTVKKK